MPKWHKVTRTVNGTPQTVRDTNTFDPTFLKALKLRAAQIRLEEDEVIGRGQIIKTLCLKADRELRHIYNQLQQENQHANSNKTNSN